MLHPQPPHKSHHERIAKLHEEYETRVQFLKEREQEKTRRRKEALRKVAPGYEPPDEEDEGFSAVMGSDEPHHRRSGILEPTRKSQTPTTGILSPPLQDPEPVEAKQEATTAPRDVMDDLVEGLARMDEQENRPERAK